MPLLLLPVSSVTLVNFSQFVGSFGLSAGTDRPTDRQTGRPTDSPTVERSDSQRWTTGGWGRSREDRTGHTIIGRESASEKEQLNLRLGIEFGGSLAQVKVVAAASASASAESQEKGRTASRHKQKMLLCIIIDTIGATTSADFGARD